MHVIGGQGVSVLKVLVIALLFREGTPIDEIKKIGSISRRPLVMWKKHLCQFWPNLVTPNPSGLLKAPDLAHERFAGLDDV